MTRFRWPSYFVSNSNNISQLLTLYSSKAFPTLKNSSYLSEVNSRLYSLCSTTWCRLICVSWFSNWLWLTANNSRWYVQYMSFSFLGSTIHAGHSLLLRKAVSFWKMMCFFKKFVASIWKWLFSTISCISCASIKLLFGLSAFDLSMQLIPFSMLRQSEETFQLKEWSFWPLGSQLYVVPFLGSTNDNKFSTATVFFTWGKTKAGSNAGERFRYSRKCSLNLLSIIVLPSKCFPPSFQQFWTIWKSWNPAFWTISLITVMFVSSLLLLQGYLGCITAWFFPFIAEPDVASKQAFGPAPVSTKRISECNR